VNRSILSRSSWALVGLAVVVGCSSCKKDDEETETGEETTAQVDTTPPAATPTPAETVDIKPATSPPAKGITPRAKAELDGKEPAGTTGNTLTVGGAKGAFVVPKTWLLKRSGMHNTATSKDKKARFAAGKYDGSDQPGQSNAAATALGLTECQWAAAENITLGKDKFPATVSDGTCKSGGTTVNMASVAVADKDVAVLAVGGWDSGANDKEVFEIFRTAKKVKVGVDPILACCNALQQNAAVAPLQQKGAYLSAAAACRALVGNPQGRAALGQVRGALMGMKAPAQCY